MSEEGGAPEQAIILRVAEMREAVLDYAPLSLSHGGEERRGEDSAAERREASIDDRGNSERGSHSIPEAQTTNDVERESKTAEGGGGGEETARLMGRPDLEIWVSGLVVINFGRYSLLSPK